MTITTKGAASGPPSTCRRCGASIRWVQTARTRSWMPLDAEPTRVGNVVLNRDGLAVVLNDHRRDEAVAAGREVWRAHFASCGKGAA